MKKTRVIQLVVLAFLIGGFIGNQATEWYKNKIFRRVLRTIYLMQVTTARGTLRFIRSGKLDQATKILEIDLKGGLKGLQRFTDYSSEGERRKLEEIEEENQVYREDYPSVSSDTTDWKEFKVNGEIVHFKSETRLYQKPLKGDFWLPGEYEDQLEKKQGQRGKDSVIK